MRKYPDISQRKEIVRAQTKNVELIAKLWHLGLDGRVFRAPVNKDPTCPPLNRGGLFLRCRNDSYVRFLTPCHANSFFSATLAGELTLHV